VLPRSIFSSDQHDSFRKGSFKKVNLAFKEVWDLKEVKPLFNVPSCVLFAKKGKNTVYPLLGKSFNGELARRNASLIEAEESLTVEDIYFSIHRKGKRSFWSTEETSAEEKGSIYKAYFHQGATIVPRSAWFVEVKESPLGFDPSLPLLESSERAKKEAKNAYKGLVVKGNVENNSFMLLCFLLIFYLLDT